MIPKKRIATHPGVILLKEYLEPMGLTEDALANHIGIPVENVQDVVAGKRDVTPNVAWRLSDAFGTSPEFWLNLQATHDLSANRPEVQIPRLTPVNR